VFCHARRCNDEGLVELLPLIIRWVGVISGKGAKMRNVLILTRDRPDVTSHVSELSHRLPLQAWSICRAVCWPTFDLKEAP